MLCWNQGGRQQEQGGIGWWAPTLPGWPNSGKCWEIMPVLLTVGEPILKSLKGCHKCFCRHILTSREIFWPSAESTTPRYAPQCWELPWDWGVVTQVGTISWAGSDAADIHRIQSSFNLPLLTPVMGARRNPPIRANHTPDIAIAYLFKLLQFLFLFLNGKQPPLPSLSGQYLSTPTASCKMWV